MNLMCRERMKGKPSAQLVDYTYMSDLGAYQFCIHFSASHYESFAQDTLAPRLRSHKSSVLLDIFEVYA